METKQRNLCLTLACTVDGFEPGSALALAHRVPPIPHPWCNKCEVGPRLQHLRRNFQPPPIGLDSLPCHGLREHCQALHCCRTCFIVNPDRGRWQRRPQCPGRPSRNPCEKDYPTTFVFNVSTSSPQGWIFSSGGNGGNFAEQCLCGKQCQCLRLPQRRTS